MPTINLFHFTKKLNSTAIPDASTATAVTFTYKSECSAHSPVLLFEWDGKPDFTYAQIDSTYYFITDIIYVRQKLWELALKQDCLATFRDQIKNSSQLVDRTSVAVDSNIIDSFYPRLSAPAIEKNQIAMQWYDQGSYILSVADGKGVKYYALTYGDFITLTQKLFAQSQDSLWDTIADATKSITRSFLNVMQYIISCHWVPLAFATETGEQITLGYWPTGVIGTPIVASAAIHPIGDSVTLQIANNARTNAAWLNSPAYNRVILHLPMCGNIELDASIALSVNISVSADIFGKLFYNVQQGQRVYKLTGDCGVPIPLSSSAVPASAPAGIAGMVSGIGSIVAGAATGGSIGQIIGGIATAGVAETALIPESQTTGSQAGFLAHKTDGIISVTSIGYNVPADMSTVIGYPLLQQKTLTTNGYYLILRPVVNFGDYYENAELVAQMKGGFYIE